MTFNAEMMVMCSPDFVKYACKNRHTFADDILLAPLEFLHFARVDRARLGFLPLFTCPFPRAQICILTLSFLIRPLTPSTLCACAYGGGRLDLSDRESPSRWNAEVLSPGTLIF